jgi:hypothetical protein
MTERASRPTAWQPNPSGLSAWNAGPLVEKSVTMRLALWQHYCSTARAIASPLSVDRVFCFLHLPNTWYNLFCECWIIS